MRLLKRLFRKDEYLLKIISKKNNGSYSHEVQVDNCYQMMMTYGFLNVEDIKRNNEKILRESKIDVIILEYLRGKVKFQTKI